MRTTEEYEESESQNTEKLNVVVVNSIHPAVIFQYVITEPKIIHLKIYFSCFSDVLEYGLTDYNTLPRLDSTYVQTCCVIADIDFDGVKEIIIGNTQAVSGKKCNKFYMDFTIKFQELLFCKRTEKGWGLEEVKPMAAPILALKYIDMRCDGIKDLVVLYMKGVHVLQVQ